MDLKTRRLPLRTMLGLGCALLVAAAPLSAATIDVTDTADLVQIDGLCSLREAVDNANLAAGGDASGGDCIPGDVGVDTIEIPAGTFVLSLTGATEDANARGDLDLLDSVHLVGAGPEQTFIESDGTDRILDAGPAALAVEIEIQSLRLVGGIATGTTDGGGLRVGSSATAGVTDTWFAGNVGERGGGIFNEGTLTIVDSTFFGNQAVAGGDGGGIFNFGNADLTTVLFSGDSAESRGGGIYNTGVLTVDDTHFSFNSAVDGGGIYNAANTLLNNSSFGVCNVTGNGGAVYQGGFAMAIDNGWFINNSAEGNGGSLYTATTMILQNSLFQGGIAFQEGGGIYHHLGNLIVRDTRIESNQSGERGGGVSNHSNFQAQRVEIYNNYTQFAGGGMYNAGAAIFIDSEVEYGFANGEGGGIYNANFLSFTSSLLTGSGSQLGGGIYAPAGTLTNVLNSTVSGNNGWTEAGGLYIEGEAQIDFSTITENLTQGGSAGGLLSLGNAKMKNTIIAGNAGDCVQSGTVTSFGYNLDGDSSCGLTGVGDISGAALSLTPLQDFGGLSRTHALFAPSPAIDSADPDCKDQFGQILVRDQRGMTRPMDGDGDTLASCDRGAFETAIPSGPLPEISDGIVGTAVEVAKADAFGFDLELTWDTASCAVGYHAIYGALADVAAHSITGGLCGLDASGVELWDNSPALDLWFLIVADDEEFTEGSWGAATSGTRKTGVPSGQCGMFARDDSQVCP